MYMYVCIYIYILKLKINCTVSQFIQHLVSYYIELAVSELFYVNASSPEKHLHSLRWYIGDTFFGR